VNIYTPVAKHRLNEIPSFDIVLDGILTKKRVLAESLFFPSELTPEDFSSAFYSISATDINKNYYPMSIIESYSLGTGEEFEDYVASGLFYAGFTVRKTKRSWDFGCDLIAKKDSSVILCQVKQVMSDKTLADGVDEIISANIRYASQEPNGLALITNAKKITRLQMNLAKENNVIIILGDSISNYGFALSESLN
jgi:HJR/Mrr/RecB family endonuclease